MRSGPFRGERQLLDRDGIVDAHPDAGVAREACEPFQLPQAHHLIADEDVAHAARHQDLGLGDLLAAHADRAPRDLLGRNDRRFVGLGVRAQPNAEPAHRCSHRVEIALEGVEVDDQRRCVDLGKRRADLGGWKVHREPACCVRVASRMRGGMFRATSAAAPVQAASMFGRWEPRLSRDFGLVAIYPCFAGRVKPAR